MEDGREWREWREDGMEDGREGGWEGVEGRMGWKMKVEGGRRREGVEGGKGERKGSKTL